jgi:hypothetical protein
MRGDRLEVSIWLTQSRETIYDEVPDTRVTLAAILRREEEVSRAKTPADVTWITAQIDCDTHSTSGTP